jgi:hypothetical protein
MWHNKQNPRVSFVGCVYNLTKIDRFKLLLSANYKTRVAKEKHVCRDSHNLEIMEIGQKFHFELLSDHCKMGMEEDWCCFSYIMF